MIAVSIEKNAWYSGRNDLQFDCFTFIYLVISLTSVKIYILRWFWWWWSLILVVPDCVRLFVQAQYVFLLCSFKEQLQQHVRVHALDAVRACWELEQSLQSLTGLSLSLSHSLISLSLRLLPSFITSSSSKSSSYRYLSPTWQSGVSPSEGTGATMSDDEDDQVDSEVNVYDGNFDGPDNMGFGPLVPTESERTLMERVRQELKHELKQVTKNPSFLGFWKVF